ncbi:PREDICTED: uncharacterized protein LOC105462102 isoform X2 [Wasmannia auropunctata]|uniref:uncharacterized protein LOC105462102 isoform X2 n=1 Tax=Wasmannia auropunctata TaxID=64793 RepID=UPI0005EE7B3C|nr:PREDICTED: uncharacterized protein LOC105462102 isoform X2 [Wasmannia auropunctata]XP_011706936.1 PREDICTED: uncharacterized protein LOC105462102 isoform X2 [Wasmannia auropunctata]XP_011706937.1 PREDICTED: uncharacterized protein LOC105462102 isoform X2 [Wasmannia auropunctata]
MEVAGGIQWLEQAQTKIMNDDNSDRVKHDNIQNTVKETISSARNQSDNIDEYVKDVNERYELAEARSAVKHIEYIMKYIVDENFVYPKDYDKWTNDEKYEYAIDSIIKKSIPNIPDSVSYLLPAVKYRGDCGRNSTDKPLWLDMEMFQRGQKFVRDHDFSNFVANALSLFVIFSSTNGLKPLIFSRQSHTPYLAFKRYVSTACRVTNWMTYDPWTVGTRAYNDVQAVRRMHRAVRLQLCERDDVEIDMACKIRNPWCPDRETILEDFSSCPALMKNGINICEIISQSAKGLNQADMAATQFAFLGLIVLYPHELGFHASDEDMAAFCHTWRGLGYLLGMEDQYNFCRGSLKEIKQRSRDFVEFFMKPSLLKVTPEWEHMLRCFIEGSVYFGNICSFKVFLLFVTDLLNFDMPRMRSTLTYSERLLLMLLRYFRRHSIKQSKLDLKSIRNSRRDLKSL